MNRTSWVWFVGLGVTAAAACEGGPSPEDEEELGTAAAPICAASSPPEDPQGSLNLYEDADDILPHTLRFADVTGDGLDEICGHDGNRIVCATRQGIYCNGSECETAETCPGEAPSFYGPYGVVRWGAEHFNSTWLASPSFYETIQYPDVNHDGRADVCGRAYDGIYCATSGNGDFNTATRWTTQFRSVDGWTASQYYRTIRFPDVNGDGRADVCGRGSDGIYCGTSNGVNGFSSPTLWSAAFSDGNGWAEASHYETLRFVDIDGDGDDDVCGRGGDGIYCAENRTHAGFDTPSRWTAQFADPWWRDPQYYQTIQFADINGDGMADVCGRGSAGLYCGVSYGTSSSGGYRFSPMSTATLAYFTDAAGWGQANRYRTIRLVDVNGDGTADVCGRGTSGVYCATARTYAQGFVTGWATLFNTPSLWVENFGDNFGWGASEALWGTVQPANMRWNGGDEICGRGDAGRIWCSNR